MNRFTLIAVIALASAGTLFVAGTSATFAAAEPHAAASEDADHDGHEHATGHGEGEADLNPLGWRSDTAVWTFVIFVIVVAVLGKFAFRPIADALDAREKGVADNIASAAQANEEAKNILSQYQQKLSDSKDEVRRILETARKDAQRNADGILEKAKDAAAQEHVRAVKEIESATANALQSIAEKSATLATDLAGKMIRKEVTPENHRDLIRGALDEFAKN